MQNLRVHLKSLYILCCRKFLVEKKPSHAQLQFSLPHCPYTIKKYGWIAIKALIFHFHGMKFFQFLELQIAKPNYYKVH